MCRASSWTSETFIGTSEKPRPSGFVLHSSSLTPASVSSCSSRPQGLHSIDAVHHVACGNKNSEHCRSTSRTLHTSLRASQWRGTRGRRSTRLLTSFQISSNNLPFKMSVFEGPGASERAGKGGANRNRVVRESCWLSPHTERTINTRPAKCPPTINVPISTCKHKRKSADPSPKRGGAWEGRLAHEHHRRFIIIISIMIVIIMMVIIKLG